MRSAESGYFPCLPPVGIDTGKGRHWGVVVGAIGATLWSRRSRGWAVVRMAAWHRVGLTIGCDDQLLSRAANEHFE